MMTHKDMIAKLNEYLEDRGHAFYDPSGKSMMLSLDDYADAHLRLVESDWFNKYELSLDAELDTNRRIECALNRGNSEGYYLTIQYFGDGKGQVVHSFKLFDRQYALRLLNDVSEFLMDI